MSNVDAFQDAKRLALDALIKLSDAILRYHPDYPDQLDVAILIELTVTVDNLQIDINSLSATFTVDKPKDV